MLGLCAMRLLSESGTDEQYVEAVRKWLADPLGSFTRHIRTSLVLFPLSILLLILATDGLGRIAPEARLWLVFLPAGVWAGLALFSAGFFLLIALRFRRGLRMDRLMVKYRDELGDRLQEVQETQESAPDDWYGFAGGSFKSRAVRFMWRADYALKAQTDNECITLARRSLKRWRRLWPVLLFSLATMHGLIFLSFLWSASSDGADRYGMMRWGVFLMGLVSGLFGWGIMVGSFYYFTEALLSLRNPRVARLMLRFYDASSITAH